MGQRGLDWNGRHHFTSITTTAMKRSPLKPSKREIARQLIAEYRKEEEAERIRMKLEEAEAQEALRPRIGPKPPKFLPCKEDIIVLKPQKPIVMRTLNGRECSIVDTTFPGMAGEPVTVPEIRFENGDTPEPLNTTTLAMFNLIDRRALEEYLEDVQMMNEEYAHYWTE